jgi:glycine cleavage system protein P-like pyridoxal-binding family
MNDNSSAVEPHHGEDDHQYHQRNLDSQNLSKRQNAVALSSCEPKYVAPVAVESLDSHNLGQAMMRSALESGV